MSKKARTCLVESTRCVSGSVSSPDSSFRIGMLLVEPDGRVGGYLEAILQNGQLGDGEGILCVEMEGVKKLRINYE